MKKSCLLLLVVFVGIGFSQQVSGDSLVKMLEQAKSFYNGGEYEKAISELENALQFLKQLNQLDQVEAYKYLGFSYVAFGQTEKAKEQFRKALVLDPKLELDPTTVSPKIIKIFEEVKSEIAVKPPVTPPPAKPPIKPVKPTTAKTGSGFGATMRSCCVPGWGQTYRGESSKGTKLMIASSILLTSSVISLFVTQSTYDEYLGIDPGDIDAMDEAYKNYKLWYNMTALSWTGFIGVYIYNLYDVIFTQPKIRSSLLDLPASGICLTYDADHLQLGYKVNF